MRKAGKEGKPMKMPKIRELERPAAKAAYDQARAYYDKAIAEAAAE